MEWNKRTSEKSNRSIVEYNFGAVVAKTHVEAPSAISSYVL
jgi:hypothetical protein